MRTLYIRKVRFENRTVRTTLPKEVAEHLGLKETGNYIKYEILKDGTVTIKKLEDK